MNALSLSSTYHCSHTPDISAGSPFRPQDDLRRPVLSGLNVIGKVMIHPTGIAEIGNLNTDDIKRMGILGLPFLSSGG
jgi:hypothetical protein